MATYTAGTATLDVLPSLKGFHQKLAAELKGVNPTVQVDADTTRALRNINQLSRQSPTINVDVKVRNAEAAVAKAAADIKAAEEGLTNARAQSEDAAKKVDIAEKQLAETRAGAPNRASQVAAAEQRVAEAKQRSSAAAVLVETSEQRLAQVRANSSSTTSQVEAAERRLGAAKTAAENASARVSVAETALTEVREKTSASASKVAQDELRVSQARRVAAAAINDVRNAEAKLLGARGNKSDRDTDLFNARNINQFTQDAGGAIKTLTSIGKAVGGVLEDVVSLASAASDMGGSVAKGGSQGVAALGNLAGAAEAAGGPIVSLVAAGVAVGVIAVTGTLAAASLIGLADAAVTAAGAVFLIPGGIAAGGAALGVLALGTMGVTDAIDAMNKAQTTAGKDAEDSAKRQRAAAESVQTAETGLARARADAATAAEQSSERVAEAREQEQRAVRDAARAEVQAQRQVLDAERARDDALDDLAQALRDAEKAQRDLNLQVRGGALDAQEAVLDLKDAQTELNDAQKQGVTGDDLQRLQIAYQRAKLRVDETTASNADLAEQQKAYATEGVKANDQVASATDAVARAEQQLADARDNQAYQQLQNQERVADAQRAVNDAEDAAAQSTLQSQRAIEDAQRAVAQANENAADSMNQLSASQQAVQQALDGLSPKARAFVNEVWALKPAFDEVKNSVQDALFNGLDGKLQKLSNIYLPILRTKLVDIADAANTAAGEIVDLLDDPGSAGAVNRVLENTKDIVAGIGDVMKPLISAFLDLSDVGTEVLKEDVVPAVEDAAQSFADWIHDMKASGQLKDWMSGAVGVIKDVVGWAVKLGGALLNIIRSLAGGLKDSPFIPMVEDTLQKFIDFANSEEGQKFFYAMGGAIGWMASMIVYAIGLFIDIVDTIEKLIEVVSDFFNLDFGALSDRYGSGVASIVDAIKTALFGGGILGLFDKIFDVDWSKIWGWFTHGVGGVISTIITNLLPAPIKSLLEGMFQLDWDKISAFLIDGLNKTLGKLGKFVRDNPLGKFLAGLFGEGSPAINNPNLFLPGWANPFGRADGGPIVGPGGPRDDAVPLWGSNGEFVVNAAATARNRGLLEWINAGKFADGGIVGGGTASRVVGSNTSLTIDVDALANLGDVAETVTALVSALNAELAELVQDTVTYWSQLVAATTAADDTISARHTLLQQQTAIAWATMQTTAWASTNGQLAAINTLMASLAQLRVAMTNTADWAVTQFGRVSTAAADPIRWVLTFPFNQGLIAAWNQLDADFALGRHVNPVPVAFATGGPVRGAGTDTSDSIRALLSNNEFVVRAAIAKRVQPFLEALNSGQPEALEAAGLSPRRFAQGGAVVADTGSALNATVVRGQQFLRAQAGKPYVWGGVGPYGYDCSGLVSAATNVLRGEANPYRRLGVAASQPWAGFVRGLSSAFATGFNGHHTALTLGGLNAEARDFGVPVLVGGRASGADSSQFSGTASLPVVGGRFVSGGGAGADPVAMMTAAFANALSQLDFVDQMWPGNAAGLAGQGLVRSGASALTKVGVDRLTAMLTTAVGGSPEVIAAVRAVAATFGWGDGPQWAALQSLVNGESGFDPNAANPTSSARGLFQKLTSVHGPIESTIQGQTLWGLNYIKDAYGTPAAAWAAWLSRSPHWYHDGGRVPGSALDDVPAVLQGGERVLTVAQNRALESALDRLGRGGYATPFEPSEQREPVVVQQTINPSPGMDETSLGRSASRYVVHSLRRV
ncbi:aggregation-promoting factor C-terminal-like domain-containing protein [Amycolatopsis sp. NPDC004368]